MKRQPCGLPSPQGLMIACGSIMTRGHKLTMWPIPPRRHKDPHHRKIPPLARLPPQRMPAAAPESQTPADHNVKALWPPRHPGTGILGLSRQGPQQGREENHLERLEGSKYITEEKGKRKGWYQISKEDTQLNDTQYWWSHVDYLWE